MALQVRPAVEGVRLVQKRASKVWGNRALWAFSSYSGKESFSFSIQWMVSSPRTVSNLHKKRPEPGPHQIQSLNSSPPHICIAFSARVNDCGVGDSNRFSLTNSKSTIEWNAIDGYSMGIVFAIFKGFHLCRSGLCGLFCGLRHQGFGRGRRKSVTVLCVSKRD